MNKMIRAFVCNDREIARRCLELQRENHRLKTENLDLLNNIYELYTDNRRLRDIIMRRAKTV